MKYKNIYFDFDGTLVNTVDGTAAMDFDPEEAKRGLSVFTALGPIEWKNTKINSHFLLRNI